MLVANGGGRRKLVGLSNESNNNNVSGKSSSRRLINNSSSKSSSKQSTPTSGKGAAASGKNLNEQLKLKKSLKNKNNNNMSSSKKSTSKLTSKSNLNSQLKSASGKSSGKKQKLKERRHHHHHHHRHRHREDNDDDENDENEPDDEYRYRDEDDFMQVDELDTSGGGLTNEFDLPLIHMSHEEFESADKYFESRLDELKKKLDALRSIDLTLPASSRQRSHHQRHGHHHHTQDDDEEQYLGEFLNELERLELEANANLASIRYWFDKETAEIEEQFKNEYTRSIHEFQERRKELKETLRNEHEDARKQIEIERQTLDINSDVIEAKPAPTRNLRRRCVMGGANSAVSSTSNSLFSSQVYFDYTLNEAAGDSISLNAVVAASSGGVPPQTGASASFVNANQSPLLTSNLSTVVESISGSSSTANGLYFSSFIQQQVSNVPNGSIIDRKTRKVGPLAITISEDEINEDHRSLLRSLRQPHSASPKVHAATAAAAAAAAASLAD